MTVHEQAAGRRQRHPLEVWLSAISLNCACWATWKIQKATASVENTTATPYWRTVSRICRLRRSSGGRWDMPITNSELRIKKAEAQSLKPKA